MSQFAESAVAVGDTMPARLIFLIGAPRSGTTMLMRMLAAHSQIYARPEPHLITPLAHLGYYDNVDAAPFDHLQAAQALRQFVADLGAGEQDYLDACRAYSDVLYGRMLRGRAPSKRYFLDKTPANALVLPFLTRLYPHAKYVVLTRHPAAILSSYAGSFFDGDYGAAQRFNPVLRRYVPAIASFLRESAVPLVHAHYEQLVQSPADEMQRICHFLDLEFEPHAIDYGQHPLDSIGLGDPTGVNRHQRPVTSSLNTWARHLADNPADLGHTRAAFDELDDRDLEVWGYPRANIFSPVDAVSGTPVLKEAPRLDLFTAQRKLLRFLRRDIGSSRFGRLVRRIRTLCDILLRG